MLKKSTCVQYGRNGICFIINICVSVEYMHNFEVGAVSRIQMQQAQTQFFMSIHNCEIIYVYCVTYGNFMLLLCRRCVMCANIVNKLTVKCNFLYTLPHTCYI